ncbi:hypothetical protein [Bradyrhizobium sp. STM 3561]|uniref:hypothetical protein n=1 Tax=Bradyrhizobium sp. STM 3561 TaxID=578923 RepID=UPI003890CE6B
MKIRLNPLDQVVKKAERRINIAFMVTPQDLAHDRKRTLAQAVIEGAAPSEGFVQAAAIEGLSTADLARLIVAKPDVMMQRENARRAVIVQLRAAKTASEVDAILDRNGINSHSMDYAQEIL